MSVLRVLFFGDSITVGQYQPLEQTWACRISDYCTRKYGESVLVQREAVNGRTTRMALENMPMEVQKFQPHILFIQYGMNDCNCWETDKGLPRVSPDSFEANTMEIVQRGLNFGAKKVFVNTNHPSLRTDPSSSMAKMGYQEYNRAYNELVRSAVQKIDDHRVNLVDMEQICVEFATSYNLKQTDFVMPLPDGIHLNAVGHELYFNTICPILDASIAELIGDV